MMIFDVNAVEEKIGYEFKDKMLLRQCFTHSSYAYEHGDSDNELLEFFGDAVIEFIVTEYLFKNRAGDEGALTAFRAQMVAKEPLLFAVKKLGLSEHVLLGKGQEKTSNSEEKLFSSIFEALVAGIYIDGGIAAAKKFIRNTIIKSFEEKEKRSGNKTNGVSDKNLLQEYVQKRKIGSLSYETLSKTGPEHLPVFRAAVLLNGVKIAEGKGNSVKQAESKAAEKALTKLVKTKKSGR